MKNSAQLLIGSDQWYLARCDEPGNCSRDSHANAVAKAACRRTECSVGDSNVMKNELEVLLPKKAAVVQKQKI